jgi:hypothetical protein
MCDHRLTDVPGAVHHQSPLRGIAVGGDKYRRLLIGAPGHSEEAGTEIRAAALAKIKLPEEFVRQVNSILLPGATVFVTNEALSPTTSRAALQVLDADPPDSEQSSKP